jgi:anti-anti-sigma factor
MDLLPTCQLSVDPPTGRTAIVRVAGEFTAGSARRLYRVLERVADGGIGQVVVDLANVRWFELEAVAVLGEVRRRLDTAGTHLVLVGLDAHRPALPQRIDDAFNDFDTVADLDRALGRQLFV